MTTNDRIVAICNHPSGLFKWPEWREGETTMRLRWHNAGYWCAGFDGEIPINCRYRSNHEAHCLVECDLREKLAGMRIEAALLEGGGYVVVNCPQPTFFDTYLDALLSACEAVLREWDAKEHKP